MTNAERIHIVELQQKGYGYKKIATITGLPQNTVKSYCSRHPVQVNLTGQDGLCRNCKKPLEQLHATKAARQAQAEAIGAFMFEVQELDALTEFDEKLWLTIIDTVTVHTDGRMTFKFQGGKTLTSY